jgi:hypothetical protein
LEQEQLNTTMSSLMTDSDRDVAQGARAVHDAFKRTPLRMTGTAGVLEMAGASGPGSLDWAAADRLKEESELEVTIAQEDMER